MLQIFAVLLLSCVGAFAQGNEPMVLPTDPAKLTIVTDGGAVALSVEIARSATEHERGLMYRGRLDALHGMLFVMGETRELQFWMKNTPEPLDIVFIGRDGKIVSVRRGDALSTAVISSGGPCAYVLEIATGEASRLGLAAGDRVSHPAMGTAP